MQKGMLQSGHIQVTLEKTKITIINRETDTYIEVFAYADSTCANIPSRFKIESDEKGARLTILNKSETKPDPGELDF